MNDFPVGSMVTDRRKFAGDLPYWVVTSSPERGRTCTFVWVKAPKGERRSKRNVAFLTNINFVENE